MDDIELLVREARPDSGHRDRPLSDRAERELEALVAPRARLPRSAHIAPRRRRRRGAVVLSLAVGAVAVIAAIGIGGALESAPNDPRAVSTPAEPDPSIVLSRAADQLAARDVSSEGAQESRDGAESGGEAVRDTEPPVLQSTAGGAALVGWLTSSAATPRAHAELLESLAAAGRASSAARGTDPAGNALWRVSVDEITLVIRADTGAIVAVVDADGVERAVPSTR